MRRRLGAQDASPGHAGITYEITASSAHQLFDGQGHRLYFEPTWASDFPEQQGRAPVSRQSDEDALDLLDRRRIDAAAIAIARQALGLHGGQDD
jgi:hypothetical protein